MEPTQLQLALNVVTITGVTSLAGYCYLLKKENRKLATQTRKEVEAPRVTNVPVIYLESTLPAKKPVKAVDVDIRTLASSRRNRWVNGLASSISR
jgi:hypothetical protein